MLVTTLLIRVVRNIDFWRGNYRDKDMPRYDLSIVIFDTIRYIVPSLLVLFYFTTFTPKCFALAMAAISAELVYKIRKILQFLCHFVNSAHDGQFCAKFCARRIAEF